jgi:CO/xanthine dehydrogenase FAD-binding subunit
MQAFEYLAAKTIDQALTALNSNGGMATLMAGGTDVLVQLRSGRRHTNLLVDVKDIPELNELSFTPDKGLVLGAAVPCYRIYENKAVATAYPGLTDAALLIGGIQIQGRATIGGNLCNAAPSGDSIPPTIVLGGICTIMGSNSNRQLAVEDICTGPGRNALKPEELLTSIKFPPPPSHSGASYLRFIPRNEMDIAVAGVASSVILDNNCQFFVSARIALASVGPTPIFAREASDSLTGKPVSKESIKKAARLAMDAATPINDMRGTVKQRIHLIDILTQRTLSIAVRRAKGDQ